MSVYTLILLSGDLVVDEEGFTIIDDDYNNYNFELNKDSAQELIDMLKEEWGL